MIAIINYGVGNLQSIVNALDYIGVHSLVTSDRDDIFAADQLILPGVGSFSTAMLKIRHASLVPVLEKAVFDEKKPLLGICLGMQLLTERGLEGGDSRGLGWIEGVTERLGSSQLKIPHVGWNRTKLQNDCPLFRGLGSTADFYYVHSYVVKCDQSEVVGKCNYGYEFPAAVRRGRVFGTQFHPEKSQEPGLLILRNFAEL